MVIKSRELVKKIRRGLKREKFWQKGLVEQPIQKKKNHLELLNQRIEYAILTARDFHNPEYLLPKNPFFRFIKKRLLSFLRVYTRTQITFNKNVLNILGDIYKYLQILEKDRKK
ncbi:hypothetical protein A3F57_04145 [Candidatus Roizmanbacteria bacterium RIFCSPHIGHO2_12_FULL_36_11]|nr:MAG: hypothetical protein A3F57_04145 [Candidatus Roizmanbacteria bacterium RIFCSPHIGHO2_12_FULL_36_11]